MFVYMMGMISDMIPINTLAYVHCFHVMSKTTTQMMRNVQICMMVLKPFMAFFTRDDEVLLAFCNGVMINMVKNV